MKVIRAKSAGFCFGVERAIGIAIGCTDGGKCKVYTDGPLIHNRQMMERLQKDGILEIGDYKSESSIEDEYRKWELRKLYYAENILFETTGSYSDSLTVLQETLAAYAPNDFNKTVKALDYTIETTSHSDLITCPSADGAHLLLLSSNGKVEKVTR